MPEGLLADQAPAPRPAAVEAHHLGVDAGLVDEDQLGGVEVRLISLPPGARLGHVRSILFGGMQSFF